MFFVLDMAIGSREEAERKKRKLGHFISRHFGFSSLRNGQTIEQTTAWTAISSTKASTRDSFLHLSGARHMGEHW